MSAADADASYRLKCIHHHERDSPVLMQNENGPCPLLAIANVLLLRGELWVHPDRGSISFNELGGLLGELMLEKNALSHLPDVSANQQRNLHDGMALFPKLQRGLDVNVRFNQTDAFEFSEDLVIFDLLGIRLLHGWLVDPQVRNKDAHTHGDTHTCTHTPTMAYPSKRHPYN